MRILVINYEYPPIGGGGGFVTKDICEHFARRGHGTTVVTSHFNGLLKQEVKNGVKIIRVPVISRKKMEVASMASMLSYFPASVFKTIRHIKKAVDYEVLNTHFAIPSGPTGYVLSKIFRIPNVLSIHGGDIFDPSKSLSPHETPFLKQTVRTMLASAERVVAQSSDTKNNASRYYDINRSIDTIPLGIKKPVFERKSRWEFDVGPDDFVFCTIGRLVKRKNITDILKVLAEIKNNYKFKFVVIGEGPEHSHILRLGQRLNLDNQMMMLGNVSDEEKFQILDLSDCYLSSAMHEGFGLVFLEAMETGNPIICYNRGGQNDFLVDGKTGFLVEIGDRKKFLKKVLRLMNNVQLCSKISAYNRKLVKKYYISTCAEKYLSLFNETILEYSKKKKNKV